MEFNFLNKIFKATFDGSLVHTATTKLKMKTIEEYQTESENFQKIINALRYELKGKDTEIKQLENELKGKDTEIKQLEKHCTRE